MPKRSVCVCVLLFRVYRVWDDEGLGTRGEPCELLQPQIKLPRLLLPNRNPENGHSCGLGILGMSRTIRVQARCGNSNSFDQLLKAPNCRPNDIG